ncbi:hypothetical protein QAD02_018527, partial [Eretmocerus hayati]
AFRVTTSVGGIWNLFQHLRENWSKYPPRNEKMKKEIADGAARTIFYSYLFFTAVSTVVGSITLPIIAKFLVHCATLKSSNRVSNSSEYIPYRTLLFDSYPLVATNTLTNSFLLSYEMYVMIYWNIMYFCCDGWFGQFTTHVCLQFRVLRDDIEALVQQEDPKIDLKSNYVCIIRRHQELLRICDTIEEVFSPLVLIVVLLSSVDICINLFDLTELSSQGKYSMALPHIGLVSGTFCQIIFYCAFAERLVYESSSVADALYNSDWVSKTKEYKVYTQIIIMRAQSPVYCTAYGFFPINHLRLSS